MPLLLLFGTRSERVRRRYAHLEFLELADSLHGLEEVTPEAATLPLAPLTVVIYVHAIFSGHHFFEQAFARLPEWIEQLPYTPLQRNFLLTSLAVIVAFAIRE